MSYALCPYLALVDLSQAGIPRQKPPVIPVTKAKKTLTGLRFGGSAFSQVTFIPQRPGQTPPSNGSSQQLCWNCGPLHLAHNLQCPCSPRLVVVTLTVMGRQIPETFLTAV